MTTTRLETLPATWDDARDLPFFRVTDRLFAPDFCVGASVLLASYDVDTLSTPSAAAQLRLRTTTPPSVDGDPERGRDVAPAQLRGDR